MGKKILTLDDLYSFYSSKNRSAHFNAKDEDSKIVVSLAGSMKFDDGVYDPSLGLRKVHLQANHTGENVNMSSISEESATQALPSFVNRPILAYIWQDNDGEYHFQSHNMHVSDEGETVYDEIPVGVIPESGNPHLVYDEEKKKTYVEVDGYLYEEYNKSAEILEKESGECSVSIEIGILDMSYNAKSKILEINSYFYNGVTILGQFDDGHGNATDDVQPGMVGSNIKLSDFSAKNNSMFSNDKVIAMLNDINDKLNQLTIQNSKEGGENSGMNKLDELLEKYSVTVEDLGFEYEGMSDEELESAFAEQFEQDASASEESNESDGAETKETEDAHVGDGFGEGEPPEGTQDGQEGASEAEFTKTFELSHDDIRAGLYVLLAATEEADNEFYGINAVFDDYFVYQGWIGGKIYGQKYAVDGDNVSFVDERYNLHAEYLTDGELAVLNEMRANYSAISEELAKFKAEPEKVAILASEDYANLEGNDAFEKLKAQENHFDLTVDEIKAQCDAMLLEYAKGHKVEFSATNAKKEVGMKRIIPTSPNKGTGRYGGVFTRK